MELIELRNIYKTYQLGDIDVPVLKGVSVTVARGELVALMGASGSGKSTLMNILGCLDRPTSGEYWLDGQNVSVLSNDQRALVRNHKFGFVFQNFNLLPRTSALENVAMPLSYTAGHLSDRQALQQAQEMLRRVGLEDRMDHEPSQLSGGQQQRVAIARALVNNPTIILGDEPTGNLDLKTGEEIIELLARFCRELGATVVTATHDHKMLKTSDRIVWIKDGAIERIEEASHLDIQVGGIQERGPSDAAQGRPEETRTGGGPK